MQCSPMYLLGEFVLKTKKIWKVIPIMVTSGGEIQCAALVLILMGTLMRLVQRHHHQRSSNKAPRRLMKSKENFAGKPPTSFQECADGHSTNKVTFHDNQSGEIRQVLWSRHLFHGRFVPRDILSLQVRERELVPPHISPAVSHFSGDKTSRDKTS
ncbi:hypothetical protein B566_EDAN016549 [Ephemera danica]|nr:hypothetical protein B566_EDAN016549 [Ephemera danica]